MTIEAVQSPAEGLAATPVLLAMRAVTKRYGARVANDAIDLDILPAEVLALLGDNGAGKSSLLRILCGDAVADGGQVLAADSRGALFPLPPGSPRAAIEAGIGWVSRSLDLADRLTALENIMLGTQSFRRLRFSRRAARSRLQELMGRFTLRINLDARVESSHPGGAAARRHIARPLSRRARAGSR